MDLVSLLIVAAVISFLITPLIIWGAKKFLILDFPWRPHPGILHKKPIPRAGGVATYLAIVAAYLIFILFSGQAVFDKHIIGILIAGFLVVVVGILDDKYDLNPYVRLVTNFLAAGIIVASGVGITWFTNPFGGQIQLDEIMLRFEIPDILPLGFLAGPHTIILLADILAFVWIVWVMNALNWSSGVDGQVSGIAVIGLVALGVAAERFLAADPSQLAVAILAFAAAGAFLGFLPWSFYPQKIMPGYGGAALAGMILASLSILAGAKLATTALLLIIPLIDGLWAIIRRLSKGRSPVWGDKEHLHHQLLFLGWSKPQIVIFYYFLAAGSAYLALTLDNKGRFFAISVGGVIILAVLITLAQVVRKIEKADNQKLNH
ncbi:undecaprenyl/decaprenyl-phosphate alpha-N-acetylglucosaminyl 1-phosphate transferase [Patescibacteria group bacterium]|nr:undecaprenyl/decaprenyl-phosphate alpha-N-acetylglucosaminyl 1-phosphate transferase [Patescibacteria group bacterium]